MQNKLEAIKNYNSIVERNMSLNITNLPKLEGYIDPDQTFEENVLMKSFIFQKTNSTKSFCIRMSSDGICGIKKIREFSNENDVYNNYKILRVGMFDCLIWPAYSMSINQVRGWKATCDDRLDLTLKDIQTFYEIVNREDKSDLEVMGEIWEKCSMARSYFNVITFNWLKSFGTFDEFIIKRNLQVFVDKNEYHNFTAKEWTKESSFSQDYFDELLLRVKKYKMNMRIINSAV